MKLSQIKEKKETDPKVVTKTFMGSLWARNGLFNIVILSEKQNKHNEKECKLCHYELIHNFIQKLSQMNFCLKIPA